MGDLLPRPTVENEERTAEENDILTHVNDRLVKVKVKDCTTFSPTGIPAYISMFQQQDLQSDFPHSEGTTVEDINWAKEQGHDRELKRPKNTFTDPRHKTGLC